LKAAFAMMFLASIFGDFLGEITPIRPSGRRNLMSETRHPPTF